MAFLCKFMLHSFLIFYYFAKYGEQYKEKFKITDSGMDPVRQNDLQKRKSDKGWLLANGLILVSVPTEGKLTNAEYQKFLAQFDYSQLPDGYYIFNGLEVSYPVIEVRNHKLVKQLAAMSLVIFEKPQDKVGIYDSNDV